MKIVTANRLADGVVVYLGADDRWISDRNAAAILGDDAAATALVVAETRATELADPYLVEVDQNGATDSRLALRESIRSAGPTVRRDLGYQAESPSWQD